MSTSTAVNTPAVEAARKAQDLIRACLASNKSFRLEAGAGAGKTYSLVEALKELTSERGAAMLRDKQQVACITYTNVACEEILTRIDRHPAVLVSTIHAFCWGAMSRFQPFLRAAIPSIDGWPERLAEKQMEIGTKRVEYELGHASINSERVAIGHNDVIKLMAKLMAEQKFRELFVARYPVLFIDEYQDTNKEFGAAICEHFLGKEISPLIGFFGDHWQRIYPDGCGKIDHASISPIDKGSNFRSTPAVVDFLNKLRPELPQAVKDVDAGGSVRVFHTNEWAGVRRKDNHWQEDLPAPEAHQYLEKLIKRLSAEGWSLNDPKETKILMLTNALLAKEQDYASFQGAFKYAESYLKKENAFIKFLSETLEPMCEAFERKRYGDMFAAIGTRTPAISSHPEKQKWADDMTALIQLRKSGTIGDVIAHLEKTQRPHLPENLGVQLSKLTTHKAALKKFQEGNTPGIEKPDDRNLDELEKLLPIHYKELMALRNYIEDKTPFSTKHGVKGQEFENVLTVFGRGWNQYNFSQMLEWYANGVPVDKVSSYERNRNLFYVSCSRSKRNLVMLFTQKLSSVALIQLETWLGKSAVISLGSDPTLE